MTYGEVDIQVHAELLRVIAYVMFWLMVSVAIFVTKVAVNEDLTDTPLIDTLGYNNICVYFDYSPAKEIAAVVYPFVELPLVAYLILNFWTTREFWQEGRISGTLYRVSQAILPVELVLAVLFRMVFVISPVQSMRGHTTPFLGFQVLFSLIGTMNLLVDFELGTTPGRKLVGEKLARVLAILYVLLLVSASAVKIIHTFGVLYTGSGIFDMTTDSGLAAAGALDTVWMVLAAVIPGLIAVQQMRTKPPITIRLDLLSALKLGSSRQFSSTPSCTPSSRSGSP